MTSRRSFLAAVAAGLPAAAAQKLPWPPGLQLYSFRRQVAKDLPGTLALVRKLGFRELELSGFYGRTGQEFRRLLDENGLKTVCYGAEWDRLTASTSQPADEARLLGAQYIGC
jgi:sugar phosphate isomerase/epimerase